MDKIAVGILGATGMVGQKFVELLSSHPWFNITALAASDRSVGKRYAEAIRSPLADFLSKDLSDMIVSGCEPVLPCKIVFSGLDSTVAEDIERDFAQAGYIVISNSSNHRMHKDVPLVIPEVNSDHLQLLSTQSFGKGAIVTNPNCSVIGMVMALKPLLDKWGLETVHVVTMQAVSGAGYPGVSSMDILDNVIPFISGEEAKVENEPLKILGKFQNNRIDPYSVQISAQCNRVPVADGHLACISIKMQQEAEMKDIIHAWEHFVSEPQQLELPSAPKKPIRYFENERYPQPKLHRSVGSGMAVSVGRLRKCPLLHWKFVILSHNTIRGAAGCAILNAELMIKKGLISL